MKINTTWSQLVGTPVGNYVLTRMDSNPVLKYHNGDHVRRMYARALEWNVPYDINLDMAILFHDAVYDNQPDKEIRSANFVKETIHTMPEWFDNLEGWDVRVVNEMILSTMSHVLVPEVDSTLIRLDLAELGIESQRVDNFWNTIKESRDLYNIDTYGAANGTVDFMSQFRIVVDSNGVEDFDNQDFWQGIAQGCQHTLIMAQTVIDMYKRDIV